MAELLALYSNPATGAIAHALQGVSLVYQIVDQVKVHRQKCINLRGRCVELMLSLQEAQRQMEGSPQVQEAIDEFERRVMRIHKQMTEWGSYSMMKSLIRQGDISSGLDKMDQDLLISFQTFHLAGTVAMTKESVEHRKVYEADQAHIREELLSLRERHDEMRQLLNNPNDVRRVMQSIQEEIQETQENPTNDDISELEQTLYYLTSETQVLLPTADLTPNITMPEHAFALGTNNDVFKGQWLGQEVVALKLPRGFNHSDQARKRFHDEVNSWRKLQHPNIVRVYGTATFGNCIYSVSAWMDNGDLASYLAEDQHVLDEKKLFLEVAEGLKYLHGMGVAHGDLRCANVLLNKYFVAAVSNFGLDVLVDDIVELSGSPNTQLETGLGSLSWRAPELIDFPGHTRPLVTITTDIWSFGMLCLEAVSRQVPYYYLGRNQHRISTNITSGTIPTRPTKNSDVRGVDVEDWLWNMLKLCWQVEPLKRPVMSDIVTLLKTKQAKRGSLIFNGRSTSSPDRIPSSLPTIEYSPKTNNSQRTPPSVSPLQTLVPIQRARDNSSSSSANHSSTLQSSRDSLRRNSGSYSQTFGSSSVGTPHGLQLLLSTEQQRESPELSSGGSVGSSRQGRESVSSEYAPPSLDFNPWSQDDSAVWTQSSAVRSNGSLHQGNISLSVIPPSTPELDIDFLTFDINNTPNDTPSTSQAASVTKDSTLALNPPISGLGSCAASDLVYGSGGEVEAGSVKSLVHRLVVCTGSLRLDMQFQQIFCTCHAAFISANDLFDALTARYKSAEQTMTKYSMEIRCTILNVLCLWMQERRFTNSDLTLLRRLHQFSQEVLPSTARIEPLARKLLALVRVIETQIHEGTPNWMKAHSSRSPVQFRAGATQPKQFAIGLTILFGDLHQDLKKCDFITYLHSPSNASPLHHMFHISSKLTWWVRRKILDPNTTQTRTSCLRTLISIAQYCLELHNYIALDAILRGCDQHAIKHLKFTFGDLEKAEKKELDHLMDVFNPKEGFKHYRDLLVRDKASRKATIPDLRIHVDDLKALWRRQLTSTLVKGKEIITFQKFTSLVQIIETTLQFQSRSHELGRHREDGPLSYLETELEQLDVSPDLEEKLKARLSKLCEEEMHAYDARHREVKGAGFVPNRRGSLLKALSSSSK